MNTAIPHSLHLRIHPSLRTDSSTLFLSFLHTRPSPFHRNALHPSILSLSSSLPSLSLSFTQLHMPHSPSPRIQVCFSSLLHSPISSVSISIENADFFIDFDILHALLPLLRYVSLFTYLFITLSGTRIPYSN